jgi:hypothetical protein
MSPRSGSSSRRALSVPWVEATRRPGIGLSEHHGAGGGVIDRDLHDCLFDGQSALDEAEVAGLESDQLAPPQAGVDGGLHHQPRLGGKGGQDGDVLVGRQVRALRLIALRSLVWAQGLKVTTRSRRARSNTECSGTSANDRWPAELLMSVRCPQTLPRKPAMVSEGWRKLSVSLTCGFTLTSGAEERWCELRCGPDTALITQRSQAQILPPLLCGVSRHR